MTEEDQRLFSISILYRHPVDEDREPIYVTYVDAIDHVSFWTRGNVREGLRFVGREVTKRTQPNQRQSIEHMGYRCHTFVSNRDIAVAVVSTLGYPHRVAHDLITNVFEMFMETDYYNTNKKKLCLQTRDQSFSGLNGEITELLTSYQDPEQVDRILMIQNQLNQTRDIVLSTLDKLLERGESLESLLDRTNDLSFQTKHFAKRTDDLNKCCNFL
eukprot:TRINITY_DN1644_c0_g1_i1.p1 TRINITY_DN1644_c0_g1~~TRINITY_DN1644_c0_g1_i1.p1  ORF type:complete len:215 (-),score=43.85 TRINITY_DN1644_c0_g1_i1:107-751(-)